jgi:DNA repair protein RadD
MTLPLFDRPILVAQKLPSLRPYQQRGIDEARRLVVSGKKRILMVAPTGAGKMMTIAAITRTATVPVLFVAHRMELIDQCVDQLQRQGITSVGVIRAADDRYNPGASVQVASIQTLIRRDKPPAGLVHIDEAHRSRSDSYQDHVFNHYKDAIILGWTASPSRLDGRPLGAMGDGPPLFEELVQFATYSELFKRSDWLVAPDCYGAPARADLSAVRTVHGDFEETALGVVMSQDTLVGNLLDHWLLLSGRHPTCAADTMKPVPGAYIEGERRRTFIFAVNIEHSKRICDRFAKAGVRIEHLDGTTPESERRSMLKALRAGELECISNCNVLLEGVDAPEVKCVVHARPTQSLVLWLQSCGRIFRPWMGIRPLILDHAGNWERHGAPHEDRTWSLTNNAARRPSEPPTKICKKCFAYVPAGCHVCPYCAYIFTVEEMKRGLPHETNDSLVLKDASPEVVRKEFFDKMATLARLRGYKPGYASAKHKENYGAWPPYEWSDALKASFAQDPHWQEAVGQRSKRKEEEEAAMQNVPAEMVVGEDPAGLGFEVEDPAGLGVDGAYNPLGTTYAPNIGTAFADWWDSMRDE